jgi:hypothetical protein
VEYDLATVYPNDTLQSETIFGAEPTQISADLDTYVVLSPSLSVLEL